jgi:adenosine/AMP kinase
MELTVVPIVKPDDANFIFGQSHFIKTVEDLHEALVGAVPRIRFGLAFCEAPVSGWCAGRVMTKPHSPSHATTRWPSAPATLS